MAKSFIPLRHEVIRVRRLQETGVNDLGNDVIVDVEDEVPVKVAGWATPQAAEPKLAGHDRRTVVVELLAPTGEFRPEDAVRIPGRDDLLEVVGEPENYDHGPFGFAPGIEVVNLGGIR